MNAKTKKLVGLISAILILVLTVGASIAAFCPVITLRTTDMTMDNAYVFGSFTQEMDEVSAVDVGIVTFLPLLTNLDATSTILKLQFKEAELASLAALEYKSEYTQQQMTQLSLEILEITESMSEAEVEKIDALMEDESYTQAITAFFALFSIITENDLGDVAADEVFSFALSFALTFIGLLLLVIALVAAVIIAIIILIQTVLRFLKVFRGPDLAGIIRLHPSALMGLVMMELLAVLLMNVGQGVSLSIGEGLVALCILFLLLCLVNGMAHILMADTINKKHIITVGLAALTAVLLLVATFSALNLNIHEGLVHTYSDVESSEITFQEYYGVSKDAVTNVTLIAAGVEFVLALAIAMGFSMFADKCRLEKVKMKTGIRDYGSMLPVGICIAVAMIVSMVMLQSSSADAYKDALANDKPTLFLDAYKDKDTAEYSEVENLREQRDELQEELADETDEDVQATIRAELAVINTKLEMRETNRVSALYTTLVLGILLTAASITDMVLKKKITEPEPKPSTAETA